MRFILRSRPRFTSGRCRTCRRGSGRLCFARAGTIRTSRHSGCLDWTSGVIGGDIRQRIACQSGCIEDACTRLTGIPRVTGTAGVVVAGAGDD